MTMFPKFQNFNYLFAISSLAKLIFFSHEADTIPTNKFLRQIHQVDLSNKTFSQLNSIFKRRFLIELRALKLDDSSGEKRRGVLLRNSRERSSSERGTAAGSRARSMCFPTPMDHEHGSMLAA